jgi:tetratricopeptide (TPR) repeat protein
MRVKTLVVLFFVAALVSPVLAADRDAAMALLTGADALITSGDHAKALELVKRAKDSDSTCPMVYMKEGQCQEALNKPRDAFRCYQRASELAKKENDSKTSRAADDAAKKLGAGLLQISEADKKLATKLLKIGKDALDQEQLETARLAFGSVMRVDPDNDEAKAGLGETEKALAARGDPIKAKIAGAMLSEVFYYVATGNKTEAGKMAKELSSRHSDTAAGKEAMKLLAANFEAPKNIDAELAEAKRELKERAEKAKKIASAPSTSSTATPTVRHVDSAVGAQTVDVDGMEKKAADEAKSLAKAQLKPKYEEAFKTGTEAFSKAKPGSEGNQVNLATALENFIRCEALYMRMEDENALDADVQAHQKQASMSRYSCMKMSILSH